MNNSHTVAGSSDFDFFMGKWTVSHRRLKERLVNCEQWEEFRGSSSAQPLLGGLGNIDDNVLDLPEGAYRAATLRSFDPSNGTWAIWWLDGRHPAQLDVPVRGRFENNIGQFFAEDVLGGQAIRVRFLWISSNPDRPRWEQAFSTDAGATWETNWIMEFQREKA